MHPMCNQSCPCGSGKKYKHCCMEKSKKSIFDRVYNYFLGGDKEWKEDTELNRRPGSSAFIGAKGNLAGLSPELLAFVKTVIVFMIPIGMLLILAAIMFRTALLFLTQHM